MRLLGLVAVLLITIAITNPLAAQRQTCSPRDNVLEQLAKKYKEQPVAMGVTTTGGLIEVLRSPKGETWTIIITTPKGMSCLVAVGESWRSMKQTNILEGPTI